jgi:hypothetical protein
MDSVTFPRQVPSVILVSETAHKEATMDNNYGVELLWHRRHAMQIAMQLPEDIQDALLVLEAAIVLVGGFLTGPDQRGALPRGETLRVVRDDVVLTFPVTSEAAAINLCRKE